jgi:hypothetical protein
LNSQVRQVKTRINFYRPYCGGAKPSKEMAAEAEKPKPYARKTIITVSGDGRIDSARTNNSGLLTLRLKPGSYKLFESWRYYQRSPDNSSLENYNDSCLKSEWNKEIKTIVIKGKNLKIIKGNDIYEFCPWSLPCLKESSMPPMRE